MKKIYDTIIVGGGLSGLSAGYFLSKEGKNILVIEKEKWLGGRAHSISKKGYTIDRGAMYLLFMGKVTRDCLVDLGLSEKIENVSKKFSFLRNDEIIELDFSREKLLSSFLKTQLFDFHSKVNPKTYIFLISCINAFRNIRKNYDNFKKYNLFSGEELLLRHFSQKTVDDVFEPISETFLFANLKDVSAAIVMVLFGAILDPSNKINYIRGGFGSISHGFSEKINKNGGKIVNEEVTKISKNKVFKISTNSGKTFFSKSIISSLPIPILERVFPKSTISHSHIRYTPIICDNIALSSPIKKMANNHLIFLNAKSQNPIILVGESTAKSKMSAPNGKGILYVLISPSFSKKLLINSNKKLELLIDKELSKIFPEYSKKKMFHNVNVWKNAFTLTNKEYFNNRRIKSRIEGLFVCGDSVTVGMDGVIESGKSAAIFTSEFLKISPNLS